MSMLHVAATPIGCLADASQRLKETLSSAQLIIAEDTRTTKKLISLLGISSKARFESFHSYSPPKKALQLAERIGMEGLTAVLVSDAGTPTISDPGYHLVNACHEAGVTVAAVPGPSAAVAALSISGMPAQSFWFAGFFPAKKGRHALLGSFATFSGTIIFYESCHRLPATLQLLSEKLPKERHIAVAREMTKSHESLIRGTAAQLYETYASGTKGECVVLIAPPTWQPPTFAKAL